MHVAEICWQKLWYCVRLLKKFQEMVLGKYQVWASRNLGDVSDTEKDRFSPPVPSGIDSLRILYCRKISRKI